MNSKISRGSMSASERELRSRAAQLVGTTGLLHGTLVERAVVCGKKTCRCARGEKHRALYLTLREGKRQHQLYIPAALEPLVRDWVEQDRTVRGLLAKLSGIHRKKIEQLKKKA